MYPIRRSLPKLTTALCLLPFALGMRAQSPQQLTYKVGKVVFTNPDGATQEQLEALVGLHAGTSFKPAQLSDAAQRLTDTGYFESVGAQLEGMQNKVTVTFELKPFATGLLLHAGFQNFVWLTPAETVAAVRSKVPLFNGYLPEGGAQSEQADAALTSALEAKGVTATVHHETVEPTLEHPERVVEFRVERPLIRVSNVKLGGVSKDLVPYLQKSVNDTAGKSYNAGLAGVQTITRILAPLLDAGYVEAALADVAATPTIAADGTVTVVVSATLSAGDVYKLGKLSFAGSPLETPEAFAATAKLHTGDIASHKALMETLAPLDAAYRRRGYIDVVASATPTLDKSAHTVDYAVTVTPGEPYHLHDVQVQGLDPAAKAEFDRGFLQKPGDVYNPEYIYKFLKNNSALRALTGYSGGFKAYADPNTHTVDVVMTFYAGTAR